MEITNLTKEIRVFGSRVSTFPSGIDEAFDALVKLVGGFNRSFYGISYMTADGKMAYYATAEELQEGEAEKYDRERFTIEKGKYVSITIREWRDKTGTIKNIFYELLKDDRVDRTKPAIEWYKDNDEMLCMVKTKGN